MYNRYARTSSGGCDYIVSRTFCATYYEEEGGSGGGGGGSGSVGTGDGTGNPSGGGGGSSGGWYGDPCAGGPIPRTSVVLGDCPPDGWVPVLPGGIAYEEGTSDLTILANENLAWDDETGFENLPPKAKPSWNTFYSNFPKISTSAGDIEMPSTQVYE